LRPRRHPARVGPGLPLRRGRRGPRRHPTRPRRRPVSGPAGGRPPRPSQTVGPFFAVGLLWPDGPYVGPDGTAGAFRLSGRVLGRGGAPAPRAPRPPGAAPPVPDALPAPRPADPDGRFPHPGDGFRGFGRCPTDPEGRFFVVTVKTGPVPPRDGGAHAPHVAPS